VCWAFDILENSGDLLPPLLAADSLPFQGGLFCGCHNGDSRQALLTFDPQAATKAGPASITSRKAGVAVMLREGGWQNQTGALA